MSAFSIKYFAFCDFSAEALQWYNKQLNPTASAGRNISSLS